MIWLIGCKGMLGSEIARQLEENKLIWVGTDQEVDITNPDDLISFAKSIATSSYFPSSIPHSEREIKWIINCAAYTNVEKAEEDEELASKLNYEGPLNIARVARKIGAKLIHLSTDYVFGGNGTEPYKESDEKNPLGVYGKTKLAGEEAIQKEMNTYYIFRTAWLYGFDGKNFVYTMTKAMNDKDSVKVVNDQFGTPTCAVDLAEVIIKLISKSEKATSVIGKNSPPAFGIYHFTNAGETTWYDFAKAIYKYGKKRGHITNRCEINPCSTSEYGAKVERPAYSVLSKDKITKELKIKIPDWEQSLDRFMKNRRFNLQ